ncbi:peptidoglycan-binding protein LysM [Paenibacillus hamazuiensis]|uniref:peptidoglycan-binding protein LysM n=1 Tax=Paenibacillus hamazuiensis TaxID=2936508 RepID=UPI00200E440D|nr:peptidoglycan-binding protein LysM [Paenibacillus hamazuiensis]
MIEHYGIELSFNNYAEGFRIPVNPDSIEVREEGQGKTYNIVGIGGGTQETRAGEINVIQNPRLKEINFSSFFPFLTEKPYPPYVVTNDVKAPMQYVLLIRKWQESRRPIRFIYNMATSKLTSNDVRDINIPASIEKFEWKEVAGSPGDIEYSLTLKEYVFYSARKITETRDENGQLILIQQPPGRPDGRIRPETYSLPEGMNLSTLALMLLGDDSRSKEIQDLNGLTDAEAKHLPAGKYLKIPQN